MGRYNSLLLWTLPSCRCCRSGSEMACWTHATSTSNTSTTASGRRRSTLSRTVRSRNPRLNMSSYIALYVYQPHGAPQSITVVDVTVMSVLSQWIWSGMLDARNVSINHDYRRFGPAQIDITVHWALVQFAVEHVIVFCVVCVSTAWAPQLITVVDVTVMSVLSQWI